MDVLLDLDGTLTDPGPGIAGSIRYALERAGVPGPPDADLGWCIGPPLAESFHRLLDTGDPAAVDRAIGFYRERYADEGLYENAVYPGIPEALGELRARGHRLWIATSKPRVYAARILEHFDLASRVDGVYGSELDGTRVDKADLIGYLLKDRSLVPRTAVMVGDREHDIRGARANRVRPVGVTWGYGSRAELLAAGASRLLHQVRELADLAANEPG